MPHRFRVFIAVLGAATALSGGALATSAAFASAANPVIADCNAHGRLTRHYTIAQLQDALRTLPPVVKEYTNCSDVINAALLADLHSNGTGGTGGSGGSFLPTPVIVILVLLALAAVTFGAMAIRRRGAPD
jgi:hypothetical protein